MLTEEQGRAILNLSALIVTLRNRFEKVEELSPDGSTVVAAILDGMTNTHLVILADADIKWLSNQAAERLIQRGVVQ